MYLNKHALFFTLIALILVFSGCESENPELKFPETKLIKENDLQAWMAANVPLKVIEVSKVEDFAKEHISGALRMYREDFKDQNTEVDGMAIGKTELEATLGNLGIASDDNIILYDKKGNANAIKLFWILTQYGFQNAFILDGGSDGWKVMGESLSSGDFKRLKETQFHFPKNRSITNSISLEELTVALKSEDITILDVRSEDEFTGKLQKSGAFQAGHIPGAIWLDYHKALTTDSNGVVRLLPTDSLQQIYADIGLDSASPIIVYCHSGFRSAYTWFVLTHLLKYQNVRNYDGSWIEWSMHKELATEIDSL